MDYEKKYNEALERAKMILCNLGEGSGNIRDIETIFPELAESEDERIREWLVNYFKAARKSWIHRDISPEQILAYLEKQKENPKSADSIPSDCVSDAKCGNSRHKVGDYLEGRKLADEVVSYLIKSGYQPIIKDTLDQKHFQIKIPRHKEDFFQSKEYKHCREILDEYYYEGDFAGDVYTLYVLRQKEQKPAEWSEEDEEMLDSIIRVVCGVGVQPNGLREKQVSFLKSLRPQYHGDVTMTEAYKMGLEAGKASSWKPSEEQMEALHTAMYLEEMQFYGGLKDKLRDLYVQLKKL